MSNKIRGPKAPHGVDTEWVHGGFIICMMQHTPLHLVLFPSSTKPVDSKLSSIAATTSVIIAATTATPILALPQSHPSLDITPALLS
jgi:hypothetical protein